MKVCLLGRKFIFLLAPFIFFVACLVPSALAQVPTAFTYRVDCLVDGTSCTYGVSNPSFNQSNPPQVLGRSPQRVQSHSSGCASCWLLTYNFSTSPVSFTQGVPLPYGGSLGGNVQQLDLSPNLVTFLQHFLYAAVFHFLGIAICLMLKP